MLAYIRWPLLLVFAALFLVLSSLATRLLACCPVARSGQPVVNADQTVVILWDAANKTEHFIRKASFKGEGEDFGFLVPSPTQPELAESGDAVFPFLQKLTEPAVKTVQRPSGISCGCGVKSASDGAAVRVLDQKEVAGFNAVVLEADSADALVDWLKAHDYAYSPEVKAWAKPYVDEGWKFTALKVAKSKDAAEPKTVAAAALRISFQTDRPLFPYREPDSKNFAHALGAEDRLLRIYFLADARYEGQLTKDVSWTGRVAWANKLSADDRKKTVELLQLPATTAPADMWLTEFEDRWPYAVAPADVYFAKGAKQESLERDPIIHYVSSPLPTDVTFYALVAVVAIPPYLFRRRR